MTPERWTTFSKSQQLLMVGSEIMRAKVWQGKDENNFRAALERGLELIDLCKKDSKWNNAQAMLLGLQQEFNNFAAKTRTDDISILYRAL